MGMIKKGYSVVREKKQRQDENREKMGKRLWRFFLSEDGDEATVRFLTEEPINFYEHTVKSVRGGKERYDNVICTKDLGDCSLCDGGDRPSFKGAFLIYDKRPYEFTDAKGNKQKGKGQLRLYVQGARVLSQLDRLSERYGLTNRDYIITRSGSGTTTTYMFDRTDEVGKLSEAEITNMLPEKLRDMYDGTMDSLYAIVQNQLEMLINGGVDEDDEDEDYEEKKSTRSSHRNLVGVGDDDDDDEDDDDEEEEERPARRPAPSVKSGKKKPMFKKAPKENSVKPLFRKE